MLEVAEGECILVCGSIFAHGRMICFDCELIGPLNGDTPRNCWVQQICHAWPPHYGHALRHTFSVSSCSFEVVHWNQCILRLSMYLQLSIG